MWRHNEKRQSNNMASEEKAKDLVTKLELAVNVDNDSSVAQIETALKSCKDISHYETNPLEQTITVETTLPSNKITELIESVSNHKAVVTGIGSSTNKNLGAAVAIMHEGNPTSGIRGVTRLVQTSMDACVVDGTLGGLEPVKDFCLAVHECGDISDGCNSCGDPLQFDGDKDTNMCYGYIGDIKSDINGRTSFKIINRRMKVWDVIGRSMVLSEKKYNSNIWTKLACGVIARSAGLFENAKKICACDGVTIWDERDVPIAGSSRSKKAV